MIILTVSERKRGRGEEVKRRKGIEEVEVEGLEKMEAIVVVCLWEKPVCQTSLPASTPLC